MVRLHRNQIRTLAIRATGRRVSVRNAPSSIDVCQHLLTVLVGFTDSSAVSTGTSGFTPQLSNILNASDPPSRNSMPETPASTRTGTSSIVFVPQSLKRLN
jgi:hypothetical protein